jgi:hypothetical protein
LNQEIFDGKIAGNPLATNGPKKAARSGFKI